MNKNEFEDIKVVDCGNGNILITMKKESWKTLVNILDWANKVYQGKRREAELPSESDIANYSYTYADWSRKNGTK